MGLGKAMLFLGLGGLIGMGIWREARRHRRHTGQRRRLRVRRGW